MCNETIRMTSINVCILPWLSYGVGGRSCHWMHNYYHYYFIYMCVHVGMMYDIIARDDTLVLMRAECTYLVCSGGVVDEHNA